MADSNAIVVNSADTHGGAGAQLEAEEFERAHRRGAEEVDPAIVNDAAVRSAGDGMMMTSLGGAAWLSDPDGAPVADPARSYGAGPADGDDGPAPAALAPATGPAVEGSGAVGADGASGAFGFAADDAGDVALDGAATGGAGTGPQAPAGDGGGAPVAAAGAMAWAEVAAEPMDPAERSAPAGPLDGREELDLGDGVQPVRSLYDISDLADGDATANAISESVANGTAVGITALATDADATDTVTYSLTDDAGGRFAIDAATGVVTVADASLLDYETATSHTVTVLATSTDGSTSTQTFTIALTDDTSEASVGAVSDGDATANTISESVADGAAVGITALATDADATDTVSYSLTDDAGGRFAIDAATGVVTVADASLLDYETATSHTVTVQATSTDGSTSSQTFTVNLTDANEAPTDLSLARNGGIDLNADGGNNAYLSAVDSGDIVGGLSALTIEVQFASSSLGSDGSPLFSYHAGGASDEIELAVYDRGSYSEFWIEIGEQATAVSGYDPRGLFDGNQHQVSLTWDSATGSYEIYVDGTAVAGGTGIATGHTIASGGTIVLGQEQDSNGGSFDSGQVFDGTLYDVRVFNDVRTAQEIADNAFTQVDSTESGLVADWQMDSLSGGTTADAVAGNDLTVGNVTGTGWTNSTPALSTTVTEGAADGTFVAKVSATDPDSGETFTYSLTDDAGGRFAIDATSGQITVANSALLDYETSTSHQISVQVTDSGGNTYGETYTIDLADGNDAPTDLTMAANGGVALNIDGGNNAYLYATNGGDIVGGLTALTIETTFSATTLGSTGSPLFSYNVVGASDEIELSVYTNNGGPHFQFEVSEETAFALDYDASVLFDGKEHQVSATWDSATGAWEIYVDGSRIASGTGIATGATIASGGTIVLGQEQDSLGGGFDNTSVFEGTIHDVRIFDDVRTAQEIADNVFGQVEGTEPGLLANWRMDDLSGGVTTDSVSGNDLTVGNVSGTGWTSSTPSLVLGVAEGVQTGYLVGTMSATDPDATDGFTYALTDNAGGRFAIDATTGEITVADASLIDHESATSHDITVRVSDLSGATYSEIITISINDVDDSADSNDTIYGDGTNNTIYAGGGNDTVWAAGGQDYVDGGSGNDLLGGDDGNDTIYAGSGRDTVWGGAGADTLFGGADSDSIGGDAGNDKLFGGAGNDTLWGGADNDTVDGGVGDDSLEGGGGNDSLIGGAGNDTMLGDAGSDTLLGGAGDDAMYGGAGDDTFILALGGGTDTADGGAGWSDTIMIEGMTQAPNTGDWTFTLTSGTVTATGADYVTFSADADGYVDLDDGTRLNFVDMERLEW
ncbi:MAG: cadherin domain-containing protein [Alphaproteobacteria bacterium]